MCVDIMIVFIVINIINLLSLSLVLQMLADAPIKQSN